MHRHQGRVEGIGLRVEGLGASGPQAPQQQLG